MFIQIIGAMSIGILFGIITGLIPGIHVNLISVLLLSVSPIILRYTTPLNVSIIIVSMAVTHSFLDTIPSVFLGAPEEDTAMSILPGHRLLLAGRGYEAVMLTVIGSLGGLMLAITIVPLILIVVKSMYAFLSNYIGLILLAISLFMIAREKDSKWALIIFILSGTLGLVVFSLEIEEALFPLFSGLFGIAMLITSINDNPTIPKQERTKINSKGKIKAISCATLVGWVASFMPGLGPAQAAVIGSQFINLNERGFLILVGGLSTVNMVLSLVTFYTLEKARNGAIVTVSKILLPSRVDFFVLLLVALTVGGFATLLAMNLSAMFAKIITKINYKILCVTIITFITFLVVILTGWIGLLILVVATLIGFLPTTKKVSRSQMMGCLLIPVILYFLL